MEKEGLHGSPGLQEYLSRQGYYLENFVSALELGATIVGTHKSNGFARLIDSASPVFAWRAFGTLFGCPNAKEAWFGQQGTMPVSLTKRVNGWGISDATGNVWSWGADRYQKNAYETLPQENPYNLPLSVSENIVLRGGSWYSDSLVCLRAARRADGDPSTSASCDIGVRVGARAKDSH